MMNIPTRKEINVHDTLDERVACEHFLGKDLNEAEGLFRKSAMTYQEDLMWMGPRAFRYYVHSALNYLQSECAAGDWEMVLFFAGILEFWLENYKDEVAPVTTSLAQGCDFIVEHWDRFDVTADSDLKCRYIALQQSFLRMEMSTA